MERVTGIGGVFFGAREPKALPTWCTERLRAMDAEGDGIELRQPPADAPLPAP